MNGPPSRGPLLVDSLSDLLSDTALETLRRAGITRAPSETCAPESLRQALVERGLPVYASVLDFEARCGGATDAAHPQRHLLGWYRLGCWTALRTREQYNRNRLPGVAALESSLELDGRILLPIAVGIGSARTETWMGEDGTIYLCDDVEHGGLADTYSCLLEREALKLLADDSSCLELRWTVLPTLTDADDETIRRRDAEEDEVEDELGVLYERSDGAPHDQAFAATAGLPPFEPASDRWTKVWFGSGRLLYPKYPWRGDVRMVAAPDLDSLIRLAASATQVRPTVAATWRGPLGAPPAPGETVAARLAAYVEREENVGEYLFITGPTGPRVHLERYDHPRSIYRLWEARRKGLGMD